MLLFNSPSLNSSTHVQSRYQLFSAQKVLSCSQELLNCQNLAKKYSEHSPLSMTASSITQNFERFDLQSLLDNGFVEKNGNRSLITLDITSLILTKKSTIIIDSLAEVISCSNNLQTSLQQMQLEQKYSRMVQGCQNVLKMLEEKECYERKMMTINQTLQKEIMLLQNKIVQLKEAKQILEMDLQEERKQAQYQKYKYMQGIRQLKIHIQASRMTQKTIVLQNQNPKIVELSPSQQQKKQEMIIVEMAIVPKKQPRLTKYGIQEPIEKDHYQKDQMYRSFTHEMDFESFVDEYQQKNNHLFKTKDSDPDEQTCKQPIKNEKYEDFTNLNPNQGFVFVPLFRMFDPEPLPGQEPWKKPKRPKIIRIGY